MYKLDILDKETEKLHQLLKLIKDNKNKEDRVWETFCEEMNKTKGSTKKYFQKHPQNMSNSSSEILSPRRNDSHLTKNVINKANRAKSTNSIRFSQPSDNAYMAEVASNISDISVEVVTLREEYPNRKKLKTNDNSKHIRISKSADRKLSKSKDNIKHIININEKLSQDSIGRRKPVNQVKKSGSRDIQKEEIVPEIYKDNFEQKLHGIIEKSLICMEDIRIQLDIGITQPDGLDDFERRKRRSSEFASRFSRNYLYQLNRQISDIKKLLKPASARNYNQNSTVIRQKITSSFQTVLQGLQAYLTHLPISTSAAIPEKIKELFMEIGRLCELQRSFSNTDVNSNIKSTELIDIFEVRSRCLIDKIEECYSAPSVVTLLQSASKFSLVQGGKTRKNNNKSRYSMYNGATGRKEVYWKRAVAALAKKKYNVPSKYKTAHFKHRPPIERSSNTKQPVVKAKHLERKSSTNLKANPVVDDENIRTMMEIEREKDLELSPKVSTVSLQKTEDDFSVNSDTLIPFVEKLIEKIRVENKDMTQEHVRCVLQGITDNAAKPTDNENGVIGELAGKILVTEETQKKSRDASSSTDGLVGKLVDVIKNHGREKKCEKRIEEIEQEQIDERFVKRKKRKDRKKTVTVTGARNAQLICIRDEDSLIEPSVEEKATEGIRTCNHQVHNAPKSKSQVQVNNQVISIQNENVNLPKDNAQQPPSNEVITRLGSGERTSRIKISRLPKVPLQPLKMLPKKFALNVLEYKINYLKARKGDHMYKKSSVKQPWILMGEISDIILDELLQVIGCEIEVNDVIEGIFASELI